MITCTSERSGSASSGVFITEYTPQALTISVASSTRKRLLIDQRIRRAIIAGLRKRRPEPTQPGSRIDEDRRRHHHALARLQAALDLGLAVGLDARLHLHRPEMALALGEHHHRALAGLDHRVAGHEQRLLGPQVHE